MSRCNDCYDDRYTDFLIYFPRENVRLFISIGGLIKRSNVIPVDDYK